MTATRVVQESFPFNFHYGDATPSPLMSCPAGFTVRKVSVMVLTAFNGTGAVVKVGDAGDSARLMPESGNDLSQQVTWESHPTHRYAVRTPIILTITPGFAASTGAGVVVLELSK